MINYKKLILDKIPENLKLSLIKEFEVSIKYQKPFVEYYQTYETKDKTSLAFIEDHVKYLSVLGGDSASIKFFPASPLLIRQLHSFYKDKDEFLSRCGYCYQLVSGGSYMIPHIDPPKHRTQSMVYVLSQGDTPAVTTWYKSKKEFEHLIVPHSVSIPFEHLDPIEELVAEPDMWYWYNVSVMHSVTNLSGNRMFLQAYGE